MSKLPKEIEERFDKECEHEWDDCCAHGEGQFCCLDIEHNRNKQLKSFIATILEEERKKIIDIINKYDDTRHNQEAKETIRDIINLIKEDK